MTTYQCGNGGITLTEEQLTQLNTARGFAFWVLRIGLDSLLSQTAAGFLP
jgi:hypothetical protein